MHKCVPVVHFVSCLNTRQLDIGVVIYLKSFDFSTQRQLRQEEASSYSECKTQKTDL